MNSPNVQQAATEYASRGWQVFPCKPARKIPLTTHGCKDATVDVSQIEQWWRQWPQANVALATGASSGLVVIDIDGEAGEATLERLEAEHGSLPATLEARTGGGGRHLFFVHPGRKVRNQARKLGAGLDVRGDGGYVVLPPSGHPSGEHYRWLTDTDPAPIPAWLSALVEERKRAPIPAPGPPRAASAYGKKALEEEIRKIAQAGEGSRNHTLNEAAFALGQLVAGGELERSEVEAHLFAAGTSAGLAAREVKATIDSGLGAGRETPRKAPERPLPVEPPKPLPKPVLEVLAGGKTDDVVLGVRDGDTVIGEATVPEIGVVVFEASWIRRDRFGVHAEVRLSVGNTPLKQSMINLSKHEDRTKLANAAAERLGDKAHGPALRLRLDFFAMNVWEWWTQASGPQLVHGGGFAPPRFLLEPYIVEGGITMLYGPPKAGKSYIGLLMALTLTHGPNVWAGADTTAPVAFVNLERPPDTVGYRLQRLAAAVGCPPSLTIQHEKGRKFSDVAPSTIRWLEHNPGGVIVLDSLSRMGAGDLNSNEDTNRAMDLLHSLKASVVVLAHTPRADASHVFGSVMHDAAADVLVRCEKAKGESSSLMGVRVTVDDGNDVGWALPKTWAFEFSREGLNAIRPATPEDFPDLADVRPIRERARDYLQVVGDATTRDMADELGVEAKSLRQALRRAPETFMSASPGGKGKGDEAWWTLVPSRAQEGADS